MNLHKDLFYVLHNLITKSQKFILIFLLVVVLEEILSNKLSCNHYLKTYRFITICFNSSLNLYFMFFVCCFFFLIVENKVKKFHYLYPTAIHILILKDIKIVYRQIIEN